jgi:hypothetical protein
MRAHFLAVVLLVGAFAAVGCGGPSAKVTGRVTCQGQPVVGVILFSPKTAEGGAGASVSAPLQEDGSFELQLKNTGKYTVVVTSHDVTLKPKAGQFDYPCDRSPLERDIVAGDNEVLIDLKKRTR